MLSKIYQGTPCKNGHSGLRYHCDGACIQCKREKFLIKYAKNPEEHKAQNLKWILANPDKHRVYQRTKQREYRKLPAPTRPCPDVCELPGCTQKATCLDHDHETKKFRGWLCNKHNRSLGLFGDSIKGLENALEYLRRA
jgi:Recombination endonuclease VII